MSYIHGLRLYICGGIFVIILANVLHTTVCLEYRRSEDKRLVSTTQCSKELENYDFEQCMLETNDGTKWEDPFEMLPRGYVKNKNPRLDESEKQENKCVVYMQRFVNLLLRRSGLTNYNLQSGSAKQVAFDFIINSKDLTVLQKYGESGTSQDIPDVNDALSRIFEPSEGTVFSDKSSAFDFNINIPFSQGISSFSSTVYSFIVDSPEVSIPICVVSVSLAAFYLVYVTRSYKLAAFTVLYIVFAANFGITWYRRYQEEMAERFYAQLKYSGAPPHCKGEPVPWYERLIHIFWQSEDCEQYYKKHFTTPMSQISLNAVFSESVAVLFLHPAQYIAKAYGDFITIATSSVPFWMKIIVFPVVCFIPILFLFTLLIFLLNYQISISPFTGLHILPSWGKSGCCKERDETKPTDKPTDTGRSSKSIHMSDPLETAVASNPSSPLFLLNLPAMQQVMQPSQKEEPVKAAAIKDNNRVCENCQVVMTEPSNGSGDSSQNIQSSCLKKKSDFNQEDSYSKEVKKSDQSARQSVTCSGDCCENDKAKISVIPDNENKQELVLSCQCQNSNQVLNKDCVTVSEKLKESN